MMIMTMMMERRKGYGDEEMKEEAVESCIQTSRAERCIMSETKTTLILTIEDNYSES
jgi:hypothetical protein